MHIVKDIFSLQMKLKLSNIFNIIFIGKKRNDNNELQYFIPLLQLLPVLSKLSFH